MWLTKDSKSCRVIDSKETVKQTKEKMKNIACSIRNNSLTAVIDNKVYTADTTHPNWTKIMDAVRSNDAEALIDAMNIRQAVINFANGKIKVVGNEVWYGNLRIGGVVVDRLLNFIGDNLPAEPIVKFIENLYANPSQRAVSELYTFLEHKNMPITPNGTFLAYKGIKGDFFSCTAGKLTLLQGRADEQGHIFNGVGETIECVRNQVDDNKENHCSQGIHAGSMEYATGFAQGKVVIVEINPKDVVSIPNDSNCQKLRTCKYKVVGEYELPLTSTYTSQYGTDESDDVDKVGEYIEYSEDSEDYNTGYAAGLDDGERDKEQGLKSSSDEIKIEDEYDEGYLDGYVDGYDNASAPVPVVIAQPFISMQCKLDYQTGYKQGREDSHGNGKANNSWKNANYVAGYNDGYAHKVKQYK